MRRIDKIEPFRVMQLLERARQLEAGGRHIVHMEIGEPDFSTPEPVLEAARRRLDSGQNFYTPSTGAPELQQALSTWYAGQYGLDIAPERILITPGTSGAFSLIYAVLLEAGESVLLSDPGYPCQRNFIRLAGGEPLNIPVGPATRYHLSAELVETNWQENTRAALIINPSNPTGTLIDEEELALVSAACARHGGWLISDEIYHGLTYGVNPPCALQCGHAESTIVVNGFSKHWAMTGWRIGWVIVPENLIDPARRVMQNIFISAPTLSQFAGIAALGAEREVEVMRQAYDERRRYLLDTLPGLGFDIVVEPQGAFYIYADSLAEICDFFSIGTNDLIQYTLAADRADEEVAYLYDTAHPALEPMLRQSVRAAHKAGIPIAMCGELAADPKWTELLMNMGFDSLSMGLHHILPVRKHLASLNYRPDN